MVDIMDQSPIVKSQGNPMINNRTCESKYLPLGNPDFSAIRDANMIYVDKTKIIENIASQTTPIFFSRPRRFGKSLLVK